MNDILKTLVVKDGCFDGRQNPLPPRFIKLKASYSSLGFVIPDEIYIVAYSPVEMNEFIVCFQWLPPFFKVYLFIIDIFYPVNK